MSTTYRAVRFSITPRQPFSEILVASLAELGYESFEDHDQGLTAYIPDHHFSEKSLIEVPILSHSEVKIDYDSEIIAPKNWNAEWEKDFTPVVINNRCQVRATFHPPAGFPLEIVINPKMSFGTGHHETTHLMLSHLLEMDCQGASVLDMGCGTGVLGIASMMMGGEAVMAVDIEPWCIENTLENAALNHCPSLKAKQSANVPVQDGPFTLVLANINRNVLLAQIGDYKKVLTPNGIILLSGFYESDLAIISKQMRTLGFELTKTKQKNDWVAALFRPIG